MVCSFDLVILCKNVIFVFGYYFYLHFFNAHLHLHLAIQIYIGKKIKEAEVITRIESSIADPFSLESSGHALFDIHPQRRGNLFNDEVYRLEKSLDATTTFFQSTGGADNSENKPSPFPPNHKFSRNDVIVMSLQPRGTGDFLGTSSLPTTKDAVLVEARVLNIGPYYLDVAIPAGKFATAFGPASNNQGEEGRGDPNLRLRVDRFFSDVPFKRMVAALGQLTSVPEQQQQPQQKQRELLPSSNADKRVGGFRMDNLLKDAILSTFAINDEMNSMLDGISEPDLGDLVCDLSRLFDFSAVTLFIIFPSLTATNICMFSRKSLQSHLFRRRHNLQTK